MDRFISTCYLIYTKSPLGWNAKKSNDALNRWVGKKSLGTCFYHEHFREKPFGGIAFFSIESLEQLNAIREDLNEPSSELFGWETEIHPLLYSTSLDRFLFQIEYTLKRYRDRNVSVTLEDTSNI
jgi:hypothetical protein